MSNIDAVENQEEIENLGKTREIIGQIIRKNEETYEKDVKELQEFGKYQWDYKSEIDVVEFLTSKKYIDSTAKVTNEGLKNLRRLRKAYDDPYFGKIKIRFDDGERESFYIGLTSIISEDDVVVNDWRSPIASLFYNARLGQTSYTAPVGKIDCYLENRKQIKVEDGKIKRIVDSDIHLDDEELQEILSRPSESKMKNIVNTIQEEQNEVIRNLTDKKMVVQGCAGSGKTSVALHRVSYLLFNDKKSTSDNMLIFSPSDMFSYYISNVLPELGDSNIRETTFSDFANYSVRTFKKLESYTEFVSRYYDGLNSEEENKSNRFKFSKEYIEALDKFILRTASNYRFKDDVELGGVTIPKDFLNKLLGLEKNTKLSLQERIDAITDTIYVLVKKNRSVNLKALRAKLEAELVKPKIDPRVVYNRFLESPEYIEAYGSKGKKLNINLLEYPDLIGLLYLNYELLGYPDNSVIHHLVIDEVQDYTPLQLRMIDKLFKGATVTALGDANQTINPYHKYDSLEEIQQIFGKGTKYVELNKAYRSSPEIVNYTNEVINDSTVKTVRNSQNIPVQFKEVDKKDLTQNLVDDILRFKAAGLQRICVITRSIKEANALYECLKDVVPDIVVSVNNKAYNKDTLILPSYLAKGLEFDAVISYNDLDNPYQEEDRYLYYVACTRAQHELAVYNEPKVLSKERK